MRSKQHAYTSKWTAELVRLLLPQEQAVHFEIHYREDKGEFDIWITPKKGDFPNLKAGLDDTLYEIDRLTKFLAVEPFRPGTPRVLEGAEKTAHTLPWTGPYEDTVCVPFVYVANLDRNPFGGGK